MSKEQQIIRRIAERLHTPGILGDDTYWEPDANRIYTTDLLLEGQHFSLDYFQPEDIGWRAAAVNISDIAAMGGQLLYVLVALGIPPTLDTDWIARFYDGLFSAIRPFGGQLIGGDTTGSPAGLSVTVTAVGTCPSGHTLGYRNQCQPGDYIITSGPHGLSTVGFHAFQTKQVGYEQAKQAHLRPNPRIEAGQHLSRQYSRYALMDSSDGLADAALKLAEASGVRLVLEAERLPVHAEVAHFAHASQRSLTELMLYGGEDFELVGAVPAELFCPDDPYFTAIGYVEPAETQGPSAMLRLADGQCQPLDARLCFQHFAPAESSS